MKPFPNKYDAKASEAALQARWAKDDAFVWDPNAPADTDYVIDTPPPTVSGALHVGHVYSYTQADIMARYMRMSGRNVLYPIGWDDNGLPTERLVEKVKKVRGGTMSREEFVALCKEVIPPYEQQFQHDKRRTLKRPLIKTFAIGVVALVIFLGVYFPGVYFLGVYSL